MKYISMFKISFRNIIRKRLRSLLSILMIASSVAAIIVFKGYAQNGLAEIKMIAAENQYGHVQVAKKSYWLPGNGNLKDRMLDLNLLTGVIKEHSLIKTISGRLSCFSLLAKDNKNSNIKLVGIDIKAEVGFINTIKILSGNYFSTSDSNDEIIVGAVLAKKMNLKPNDVVTILVRSIDGAMNAIDLTVAGVFTAGIDDVDAKISYVKLAEAQKLLNTKLVDIAVVKYNKLSSLDLDLDQLKKDLNKVDDQLALKTWKDLSKVYRQSEKFYKIQNTLVEFILMSVMFLGILNSVFISVVNRVGEIGTLRALGATKGHILIYFLMESLMLVFFGCLIGIISSYLFIQIIHSLNIVTDVPGASTPFQIKITFMFYAIYFSVGLALAISFFATLLPARYASNLNVSEALRRNI